MPLFTNITSRKILIFWLPLAFTWFMMSLEGPLLSAIIARLSEPKINLASFGVAFSFALLIESPIILMMSASTALVENRTSYYHLRNFTFFLNFLITLTMLILVIPPVFRFITSTLMNLPDKVVHISHLSTIIMLPWPAAIGFRRFYQGVLIRNNKTRRIAYGTFLRLITVSIVAIVLYNFTKLEGAFVATIALAAGVTIESISIRVMSQTIISNLTVLQEGGNNTPLTYLEIFKFYYPLALTAMMVLGINPIVNFFMAHSRFALESLAVFPVVNSLTFIFRGIGISFQEASIALIGENNENYRKIRSFGFLLGISLVSGLGLIAFTPLSWIWFHLLSGLSEELTKYSIIPTMILVLLPGLTVLLSYQRAILVNARKTHSINIGTIIETISIVLFLFIFISVLNLSGIISAALSLLLGRSMGNFFLFFPTNHALKPKKIF